MLTLIIKARYLSGMKLSKHHLLCVSGLFFFKDCIDALLVCLVLVTHPTTFFRDHPLLLTQYFSLML